MNIIVIPADRSVAYRSLVPSLGQLLQVAGDPVARIRPLCGPPPDLLSASNGRRLAQIVERYANSVQIFIRCLDDNGLQGQKSNLGGSSEALVRRRTFWGEEAWANLSRWLLKDFDPKEPHWMPDVRGEVRTAVRDAEVGSAASLVEVASREWLDRNNLPIDRAKEQHRLHAAVAPLIGSIRGGDPNRAQEASQRVRDILASKYAH